LEVLHRSGLVDKFIEFGLPMKGLKITDANMEQAFVFSIPPADSPFPHTVSMPQWRTEEILHERLLSLGIEVERGTTAQSITMLGNGVEVLCSNLVGETFTILADYVVGAGGAHSPLRHAMHEDLDGITYPHKYLVADVKTKGVHDSNNLISVAISPTGLVMTIELPQGRSLILSDIPDGEDFGENVELSDVKRTIASHLNRPIEVSDLRWASVYRMHRRMAPRFSQGRCFLAGDSAHLCSPMGGEGMNAGILDGASLAWMIGAVLRRGGRPDLLEAYEVERQEVARQVLASSDAMHEYYAKLVSMVAGGRPLAEPPADPTVKVTSGSMLDLVLSDSPILGFHGSDLGRRTLKPGCRFPKRTELGGELHHLLVYSGDEAWDRKPLAHRWSRIMTILDGESICPPELCGIRTGAILIRPDGFVGFQSERWDEEARAVLDQFLSMHFEPALS
jgi:2-polyprenyl-6-methoxyphenol hydroxylase-like FAD-dependent oxidoreductase